MSLGQLIAAAAVLTVAYCWPGVCDVRPGPCMFGQHARLPLLGWCEGNAQEMQLDARMVLWGLS